MTCVGHHVHVAVRVLSLLFISLQLPSGLETVPASLGTGITVLSHPLLVLRLAEGWLQRKSPGEVSGSSNKAYLHRGEANYTAN